MKIKSLNRFSTGGGVYCYTGKTDVLHVFAIDDPVPFVLLLDTDPDEAGDDLFQPVWQERHTICAYYGDNAEPWIKAFCDYLETRKG